MYPSIARRTLFSVLLSAVLSLGAPWAFVHAASATPDVQLSSTAYYHIQKTVLLTNTGNTTAYDVTAQVVLLPPASSYSQMTLTGESIVPSSTFIDPFGNRIGVFHWNKLSPHQSVTIALTYQEQSSVAHYNLAGAESATAGYNTASSLYKEYTNPHLEQSAVDTGAPQLVTLDTTLEHKHGASTPLAEAQVFFHWIVGHIRYNYSLKPAGGALQVLKTRLGICTDFAQLFVGMLRTAGIPARLVSGYVVNNGANQGGFHQWTEFYLPHVGWVPADPTWGANGYFAQMDDNWHIPLYNGIRPDVNVTWKYVPTTTPYIKIHYHYTFTTESAPPLHQSKVLPVLPPPLVTSVHHHSHVLSTHRHPAWELLGQAWLTALWHWISGTLQSLFNGT